MKNLFLYSTALIILFSCNNTNQETTLNESETNNDSVFVDDSNAEFTAADTSSTGVYQEEVNEDQTLQEALQANSEPITENESGMSFCDCVKKQKELEKIMLETEDDLEFDKAMEELNNMKSGDCKILFEGNQSTIEAKQAHERKVKNCL